MVNPNFTPVIDTLSHSVHYNISYMFANQPPQMTTPTIFLAFALLGIVLLLVSRLDVSDTFKDLSGVVASLFLLISAAQAFAVDTITGAGVVGICSTVIGGTCGSSEYVLLENHTIYHYDLIGYALGIIFIISLANLYLLWIDSKRIVNQEQSPNDRTSMPVRRAIPSRNKREKDEDGYVEDDE